MTEVAFFGDRGVDEDAFPSELIFSFDNLAGLLETLRYEEGKEIDLLEQFVEMLLSVHPLAERSSTAMLSILKTCAVLLER
mmetsp:Transcript_20039/g.27068  ORF Transcript_20039/g.27068 Transcript_20039/m.27068 type:complete len:81 (-) Transcript_20039:179-421(-)